jgi:hypothetical protein
MRLSLRILFTLLGLSIFSVSASAFPRVWTLSGVTFADGGTASGTFTYDASTNTYSAINVTTTAGTTIVTGATYSFFSNGFAPSSTGVLLNASNAADLTGTRAFALFFATALTNAGGTVTLSPGDEANCGDAGCTSPAAPSRATTAGSVSSLTNTPTNTPAGVATNTPTNTPTNTATNTPTSTPTNAPTNTPTSTPTNTPTTAVAIVPTLNESGMLIFGLLIAAAGLLLLVRRR